MKKLGAFLFLLAATGPMAAQSFFDRLDDSLTFSLLEDRARVRFSGTLDLEYYHFQQPPPGLIDAAGSNLFNPRLTFFGDAQLGPAVYFFSQVRIDRHFDPTDEGAQIRLDEYALRVTPWEDGRLSVQVGQFATVVAKWVERHLSWDNPFIAAPLVYEYALPLEDFAAPDLPYDGALHDEKFEYIPIIWGPSYATGISVAGKLGQFEYAGEIKNAALSSRPESWPITRHGFSNPTVSGRLGFRPNEAWNFGLSASEGAYFLPIARASLPPGRGIDDYRQLHLAQDISFAWRHLQLWAEFHQTRFEIPRLGDADTFGYFIEAKYKILPQLFAAVRWNQQFFDEVSDGVGGRVPWAHDVSRWQTALTYRFTAHTHLKVEYDLEHEVRAARHLRHTFAAQFTVRF